MNTETSVSIQPLVHAEELLRDVLRQEFDENVKSDAASLARMVVHIVNMQRVVDSSTDIRANAAKRLVDFAVTTTRMASRNPASAVRLSKAAEALREASTQLNS
jgi:hypothetical protein